MRTYFDYKPIPKYSKGDLVFRCWVGIWKHHPEPISRVFVKEYNGKWYVEYYFPRERTSYDESELYGTLEELLVAETESIISHARAELELVRRSAVNHGITIKIPQKLLNYDNGTTD